MGTTVALCNLQNTHKILKQFKLNCGNFILKIIKNGCTWKGISLTALAQNKTIARNTTPAKLPSAATDVDLASKAWETYFHFLKNSFNTKYALLFFASTSVLCMKIYT